MDSFRIFSFVSLALILFAVFAECQVPDLECYSCLSQGTDLTCLNDPELVSEGQKIEECEKGWCTIVRKEYTDMPGKIVTFIRACEISKPLIEDGVITDSHFTTHYRSCRTLKCNKGDGLTDLEGIGNGGPGNSTLIRVPEEVSSAAQVNTVVSVATLLLTTALTTWYSGA